MASQTLPKQGSSHLLAVDMACFVHRVFRACAAEGDPEKATSGTLRVFARFLRGRQPTHAIFAGEGTGHGSYRRAFLPSYKADREEIQGFAGCLASVEVALLGAGACFRRAPHGYEGEDLIACATGLAQRAALPVLIATVDKDLEQLVSDRQSTVAWDGADRVLDEHGVIDRWKVPPTRLPELLALAGDRSDGYHGVPGWGAVRAAEVLRSAIPLTRMLAPGGEWWVAKKYRAKFIAHREAIRVGYSVAQLRPEAIQNLDLEDLRLDSVQVGTALMEAAER